MAKLKRFGGTPVSEGVRLEVGKYTVFAVRNASRDISVRMRREPRRLLKTCMHVPFLRGATRLVRDIVRFLDGLGEAAELNPHRAVRGTRVERVLARSFSVHPQSIVTLLSGILIPIIAFACLFAAPEGAEMFFQDYFSPARTQLNWMVCAVRIIAALLGVGLICRLRVVNRLCMYKGAINKVTNCYECRDEISIRNAAQYPIITRRSEPVFLMGVLIFSLIGFTFIRTDGILLTALVRILIVLAVAAVFNEPYSALESADMTLPVRITRAPMDLLQHITVLEPTEQMLEVAVCAFRAALGENDKEVKPD
ncbi:MAG: DUF1385 domain-containing protein [Clostridia bacterium]|nr:DUF1385 domain-containing protein [Clostridia bacterium]MBP3653555.1 DUF1385 domain-containing protein [Clostridia bacterium]